MPVAETIDPLLYTPRVRHFGELLRETDDARLGWMAAESARLTRKHFGRTIRLFAPLYLSNECVNSCSYCGFSRDNPILRVTLDPEAVREEARHLTSLGLRNILLVAGEHPKFVSNGYLASCVETLAGEVPSLSLEVAPMEAPDYAALVRAGAEGLVVYQETYDRELYAELHTAGPKKDFDWRLAAPERAHEGGFRRIGVGALFGLKDDWRTEACALAAHLEHLLKRCWRAQFTVSLPRIRPCAGAFQPRATVSNREFLQLVCALRITFPQVSIVLSTRESASLRDALVPYGITMMSAGSHTEPGGYTQAGQEDLHLTIRGKTMPAAPELAAAGATGQFETSDHRSPAEIAAVLSSAGWEPVWKDWDAAILANA